MSSPQDWEFSAPQDLGNVEELDVNLYNIQDIHIQDLELEKDLGFQQVCWNNWDQSSLNYLDAVRKEKYNENNQLLYFIYAHVKVHKLIYTYIYTYKESIDLICIYIHTHIR